MDEKALQLEARLAAIEFMVAHLYNMFHLIIRSSPEQRTASEDILRRQFAELTIPGTDPAISDVASSDIEHHVLQLLEIAQSLAAKGRG